MTPRGDISITMSHRKPSNDSLGMSCPITRRDFVNGALAGCGAALVAGAETAPAATATATSFAPSGSSWTGYGGVGDYSSSNGNTEAVIDAAHRIRDRLYPDTSEQSVEESVDLVVVGGGFSGMTAAYEFSKRRGAGQTCLLLENHPIMGGEAKQNEFLVDGRRLTAPQGSNAGLIINDGYVKGTFDDGRYDVYADYYRELGLPPHFDLEPLAGGAERYDIPNYHYAPMAPGSDKAYATGYHFRGHGWALNPARERFANTPWPEPVRKEIDDFVNNRRDALSGMSNADAWLDSIYYSDLLDKLGYGAEVRRYIDPYIAVGNFGVCSNAISGYAAKRLLLPGTVPAGEKVLKEKRPLFRFGVVSFPGGTTAILRMMLARMLPGAITGDGSLAANASSAIDFAALDRAGSPLRIRLNSTVIDVRHEGNPATADHVIVTYARDGVLRKVRARSVVMGSGGWVNRRIVADLPETFAAAYREFHHGPILTANVAVRHWRFFDKLGIIAARWFEGLGWHVCVRRNVALGNATPLTPNDPVVLTFYIPFLSPDVAPSAQGAVGRARLLSTSYSEFERQIRVQMSEMFGAAGFDAQRDIAGIVLNRWGHAYCAPQPGFYLGRNGQLPPHEVLRQPHGRIVFAHSELQGTMNMAYSMLEANRAARQSFTML
jgi:spermidine dehydrogenase